jgi:hypothetical protein
METKDPTAGELKASSLTIPHDGLSDRMLGTSLHRDNRPDQSLSFGAVSLVADHLQLLVRAVGGLLVLVTSTMRLVYWPWAWVGNRKMTAR